MKVLCIGSAVVDIAARPIGKKEAWKEKQRIESIVLLPGGDAVNQSIRLADASCDVTLAACVGKDHNGTFLRTVLSERGVKTGHLAVSEKYATGTALVLVDEEGERHTFSVKGAHSTLDKNVLTEEIRSEKWQAVTLASLFSMPLLESDGLVEFLSEMQQKKTLIFADLAADKDKQGLDGIRRFLPYVTYFLPSFYDAAEMTGKETPEEIADVYHRCGVLNVVIKCGENGCYYSGPQEQGWVEALDVNPVDTTGAGDCMVALFISRILKGDPLKKACQYACAGASYSTLFYGASVYNISLDEEKYIG